MMSAVPEPHDLYQPTVQLPVVEPRGVYRAAGHRRTVVLIGAGAAGVLLALVVWIFSGDDEPSPPILPAATAAPAVNAAPSDDPVPEPAETVEPTRATASATTPAPASTTQRQATPAELITGLTVVVDTLEDQDELDDDGADSLNRRLEQAGKRFARGDARGASRKLDEFTKKLDDLRDDDKISDDAFTLLTTGATQVKSALPRSR